MPKANKRITLAGPQILENVRVAHPTLAGMTEDTKRVVDTLDVMRKRKQLTERQYLAADKIRSARASLEGIIGGAMDFDRARGGSLPGSSPAIGYLIAAELESEVRKALVTLYPKDYRVVITVCHAMKSLEETAALIFARPDPTREQKSEIGRRLREGLDRMAEIWWPEGTGKRMRAHITERPTVTEAGIVEQATSRVAHATRDKVYRTNRS